MRRDVFQAIADPIRRDIIDLLAKEDLSVNEVAEKFSISRPAVSKHLKILRECGLVDMVAKGRERRCVFIPKELSRVSSWVEQHRRLWEGKFDALEMYLEELQAKQAGNEESN